MNLTVINTYAENFKNHESAYDSFLNQISTSDSPALINMGYEPPAGLAYLATNNVRWTKNNGEIAFLQNDVMGNIVGVSCVEHSTLSDQLGSGGNRCWLLPDYRTHNEVTKFLLSANLEWCKSQNKVGMVLTFNEYNKWIYTAISKLSTGKGAAFGNVWSDWWNDCVVLPRKISLFNTPQWAVIKPLTYKTEILRLIEEVDEKHGIIE